jgi:hypothetical protein
MNFLQMTIAAADAWLERELANSEILLVDQGATPEEIENAIGPHGYVRKMLQKDRDSQIAEGERWLSGNDDTRH